MNCSPCHPCYPNILCSFVTSFYVYQLNGVPVSTITTQPPTPGCNILIESIEELICFIKKNPSSKLSLITNSLSTIISTAKSTYTIPATILAELNANNPTLLISKLENLKKYLTTSSDIQINQEDDTTGPSPSISAPKPRSKCIPVNCSSIYLTAGEINNITISEVSSFETSYATAIGQIKNVFRSMWRRTHEHRRPPRSAALFTTGLFRTTSPTFDNEEFVSEEFVPGEFESERADFVQGEFAAERAAFREENSRVQPNLINNIAKTIFGTTFIRPGGRLLNGSTRPRPRPIPRPCPRPTPVNPLTTFLSYIPPTPISTESPKPTVVKTNSYYEIDTSIVTYNKTDKQKRLKVNYTYYPSETNPCSCPNKSLESISCTFYLNFETLISLCLTAYNEVKNLNSSEQSSIAQYSGISTTCPTNIDLWNSLLIWLLTFCAENILSQLFPNLGKVKSPKVVKGVVNYMLGSIYLKQVGNFGLTNASLETNASLDTTLTVAIPRKWEYLMYPHLERSFEQYEAETVNHAIRHETKIFKK
jgi:hypothetical protein